jgi:type IV secretory pathway TrbF-like protein
LDVNLQKAVVKWFGAKGNASRHWPFLLFVYFVLKAASLLSAGYLLCQVLVIPLLVIIDQFQY